MKKIAWLLPLCLLLAACRADVSEPEELYLVSAIGFDAGNADLRVSVEVPLTRENEADKMEVLVFDGTGTDLPAAMRDLRAKLGKKLFFGHCALAVLGDGVSGDALRAALDFLSGNEIEIPAPVFFHGKRRSVFPTVNRAASAIWCKPRRLVFARVILPPPFRPDRIAYRRNGRAQLHSGRSAKSAEE